MRILGPWDRGSQPQTQRVLEGRQSFATEFLRVDTACPAHIIVETYFRECNVYFRTISQSLAAPIHRLLKGEPVFIVQFPGVGTIWLAHIAIEMHFHEYNVYSGTIRWWLAAPNPIGR